MSEQRNNEMVTINGDEVMVTSTGDEWTAVVRHPLSSPVFVTLIRHFVHK